MIPDAGASLRPEPAHIRAMLETITEPGEPVELRVLKLRRQTPDGLVPDPYTNALSGFFTDTVRAAEFAARYTGNHCAGVYVTLNPLAPYVMNWGADRIAKGRATTDADVLHYRFLFLDVDPARPEETNATADEIAIARTRAGAVLAYQRDVAWPDPAWAGCSGSGSVMLYRTNLPVDERPLIDRVLHRLDALFGDAAVRIDTSVSNPARVCRLAGTVNAKAITPQPDRPWALATGQATPNAGTVTREQLAALAGPEPEPSAPMAPSLIGTAERYDVPAILARAGIRFRIRERTYGTVYDLAECLTSADHSAGACIIQFPTGAVAYMCQHTRCQGKGWHDVKGRLHLPSMAIVRTIQTQDARPRRDRPSYAIQGGEVVPL